MIQFIFPQDIMMEPHGSISIIIIIIVISLHHHPPLPSHPQTVHTSPATMHTCHLPPSLPPYLQDPYQINVWGKYHLTINPHPILIHLTSPPCTTLTHTVNYYLLMPPTAPFCPHTIGSSTIIPDRSIGEACAFSSPPL